MDGFSKRDFESKNQKIIKIIFGIFICFIAIFVLWKINIVQKLQLLEDKITDNESTQEKTSDSNLETQKTNSNQTKTNTQTNKTNESKHTSATTNKTQTNQATSTKTEKDTTNKQAESSNKKTTMTCTGTEDLGDGLKSTIKYVYTFENDKLIFSKQDETVEAPDYETLIAYYIVLQELAKEFNTNMRGGSYTKVLSDENKITINQVIDFKTIDTEFIKNQEYIELPFTKESTKQDVLNTQKQLGNTCR